MHRTGWDDYDGLGRMHKHMARMAYRKLISG
jgi:hypothetical protein